MKSYSIVFLVFLQVLPVLEAASLPCPSNCGTCSSSTQCTTCASQYFANSSSGSLQCQACGQFCLNCTSSTNCTSCINPYVIQSDGSCKQCEISYAAKCSSVVSASQCNSGYYVSDNYCYSCLLNCADCSSSADCRSCISGYYLNSSVLTCNFCPVNCLTCDQYNSVRCLSCADGYTLSGSYTCDIVTCTIANCLYCQTISVCKMCEVGYYWSSSQVKCLAGASVLCQYGAQGPFPNQCNNKCSTYQYLATQTSTSLWCLPYKNIKLNTSTYSQTYLYAYNNLQNFTQIFSTSNSLTLQSTGQYSYLVSSSNMLTISSLSSFYKVTVFLKYRSNGAVLLSLSSRTESAIQSQNATIPAYNTVASVYKFSTIFLHSNNLQILFNSSLNLVQVLIRTKNCPNDCFRCLNQDLCEMCKAPQYVSSYKCVDNCTIYYHLVTNRTCLTSCPDFFYPTNLGTNQKYCEPCVSPCKACLTSSKCLSCISGKYLYNYTCLTTCPDFFYPATISGLCEPCISPCKLCINQTKCVSCREGYWDSIQNVCTIQCPTGYYGDDLTQKCEPCTSPCLSCRNSSTRCLTCIPNYYYHDYQCLSSCPSRYYRVQSNMTCSACRLPCLTCTALSSCLSCSYDFFYNNTCTSVCPDGFFQNFVNKSCDSCSSQCQTCEMLGQCLSCKNGTCLLQGSCISSCPPGKYYPTILNSGLANQQCICEECKLPCKECLSSTRCTSCLKGYLYASTYQCLNSCPTAYFPNNLTYECTPCSTKFTINCLECNMTACTRCTSSYLLHNGLCLTSCPSLHYKSSQTCQKCVAPCLQCTSFTQCSSCISPYLFSNGSCIIECPFGKVSILNSTTNILSCIACQSPCITCQNSSPTNCTMCTYGYFLYLPNNTCLRNCSSIQTTNTYYNELATSTCSKCMFPCKTCSTQTQCLTCQIGFLTSVGKCQNCPVATFANQTQRVCLPCPVQCSNCYSSDYCTGCKSGYYLYSHQCISDTSICTNNGYFTIGRVCQPCQMPCNHCNLTSTNCLSCLTGYIFYQPNQCITQCPKGTFRNGSVCSPCHAYCESCSGTQVYCFSCKSLYLMVSSEMSCVASCPNGTFMVGSTCQICQYPCRQCNSQTQCTSCISGTLVGTSCLTSCPSGYYSDSMTCKLCQSPCSQCENSPTTCKQCINGYYLFNDTCFSSCPSYYFAQTQAHQCLQCLGLCGQCQSHINCTTCSTGLIFYYNTIKNYGQCVSQCPISYYKTSIVSGSSSRDQCSACLPQCLTCTNLSACILCKNNSAQYQGTCISECPAQMYSHSGICQNCSPPCFNCTDAFTCTACMNNSFLLVGSAQCIVGEVCPLGFYRIPNTRNCNGRCPAGYYHRNDRTCNSLGCDVDQYKGADMFCYKKCPQGYISDQNYACRACQGEQCSNGLFYNLTPAIIRDKFYLYIIFKQDPIYLLPKAIISLKPDLPHKIVQLKSSRLLLQSDWQAVRLLATIPEIRNITIQLLPEQSFPETQLTVTFESALATFRNPLQRPSKTVILAGFDLYPDLMKIQLGFIMLIVAVCGMYKNPYMTDFGQIVYLFALVDLHYPSNLASFLQSSSIAHLHRIITVNQIYAIGKAKFSYITDLGLLSNCTINLLIIAAGLLIFLLLFIFYKILSKALNYNKVDQDPESLQPHPQQSKQKAVKKDEAPDTNSHPPIPNEQADGHGGHDGHDGHSEQRKCVKIFNCLQKQFINNFKISFLNRLVYFNYLPLSLFTFGQLTVLKFDSTSLIDFLASLLSIFVLIGLLIFPWVIFTGDKPKYTFLMLRKLVLGLILVLSVENPTYMIGVTAVISIMTGILVGAYGMQKWKVQTKFNAAMQICQAFLMILFAIFAIIGEGNHTNIRLALSWIIIFTIIGISLSYLVFTIFCVVLWGCKKFRNIDYIQQWNNAKEEHQSDNDSQQVQQREKKEEGEDKLKTRSIEKLLAGVQKQNLKQDENKKQLYQLKNGNTNVPITNNQLFWTYNDHDADGDSDAQGNKQPKAPDMLIRCVNEFSDYDPKEKREQ